MLQMSGKVRRMVTPAIMQLIIPQFITRQFSNFVIQAKAGIQPKCKLRDADKSEMVSRCCGRLLFNWIPTFAGMT